MVDRLCLLFTLCLAFLTTPVFSQTLPDNELQVDLNTYFDSFNVQVIYPSISLTKRVSESSSINLRYLVDLVTAASIRSNIHSKKSGRSDEEDDDRVGSPKLDAVTAASSREREGYRPDDVRHELGFGMSQVVGGGLLSVNGLYSKEFDYRSATVAGTYSYSFAKKNTNVVLGFVRSWDANYPKIFNWTRHKNDQSYSATLTQILSKRLIAQAIFSYDYSHGFLSNPYEVVVISQGSQSQKFQPVHPETRTRKASTVRFNYKSGPASAVHLSLRYYWDDWQVRSLTTSLGWDKHLNDITTIGLGFRNYVQSRAFFFKESYLQPEEFMTVDSKLDRGYSNEVQFKLTLNGGDHFEQVPFLMNERVQFNLALNIYHRHTATPNWFSHSKDLFAFIMSLGIRYRF